MKRSQRDKKCINNERTTLLYILIGTSTSHINKWWSIHKEANFMSPGSNISGSPHSH